MLSLGFCAKKHLLIFCLTETGGGGGGVHPNCFVSLTDENEQMFDPDFFCWFFVCNIKAREEQPLEKRFDKTIFFLPEKKSNLWRFDFEISDWLEAFHQRFFAIFSLTVYFHKIFRI